MKRQYLLPSEIFNKYDHDCRSESTKFKSRSLLFDVSVFSTMMSRTRSSMNKFYENSLYQPETLDLNAESSLNFTKANTTKNKCIKQLILNNSTAAYGNLVWANSLTCASNGDIFVADRFEHRIIVFTREFIYKYKIGSRGSEKGQFDEPADICMSESGKLFVADKNNKRVQVFAEQKKPREARGIKLNASFGLAVNLGSQLPATAKTTKTTTTMTRGIKASGEYSYQSCIELEDRPVKLCASPFCGVMAVSTRNGMIFIINELNEITSYLKLRRPAEPINILNFCLDDFGDKLTYFHHDSLERTITIRVYQTHPKPDVTHKQKPNVDNLPYKMELIEQKPLQTNYYPGISLNRVQNMKLSLDSKHYVLFDNLNLNLLEFNLEGKFTRILLRGEEHLGQVLAFDFNGDHLITSEIISNAQSLLQAQRKMQSAIKLGQANGELPYNEIHQRVLANTHVFRLKTFAYMDCACHKHLASESKTSRSNDNKRSNTASVGYGGDDFDSMFAKSINFE